MVTKLWICVGVVGLRRKDTDHANEGFIQHISTRSVQSFVTISRKISVNDSWTTPKITPPKTESPKGMREMADHREE